MDRRRFLKISSLTAGALLTRPVVPLFAASKVQLRKYLDPLPLPGVLTGTNFTIAASEFQQQLHRDLPPTTVWGYNGSYPGPTVEAQVGVPTTVVWQNNLYRGGAPIAADQHLLPVDPTIDRVMSQYVPIVAHLHGGHVPSAVDGGPFSYFEPGQSVTYEYPNNQLPPRCGTTTTRWASLA